ncbi:MAG: M48 family metallopeptidase [Bacteroidales bacterium]|jgi:putative metalloprotease|nr:M48 family metallopeptidase [Bacteroidales bacterium]MEE3390386.1 M48 family metallopeptidase [Candidatus Cryptobacteroides sp.]MCI2134753.1 M48 family metallopeptidase [Bacteroidales bacterium]MCI5719100.1 M48 family metallopeptidase [Bacteroidales bacterium]MDY6320060.1 M48 family metallopeptidase [Bacteroidales bacterium]
MKKCLLFLIPLMLLASSCGTSNPEYLLSSGAKVLQAATLTDAQIQAYVGQYVTQLDAENKVLPESSPYVKRVRNMTKGLTSVDGIPLNFKVYQTSDVNAFACADGSVRIYTGLLDLMSDDEVLGVVGHEIGHVALKHSRKQFQQALMTSAVRDAIISTGGDVAVLTASQLGDIGEALASSSFSRKQESQADDYGYDFLKNSGKNPWAMAMAFEELLKLSGGSTGSGTQAAAGSSVTSLFSSHPATQVRIQKMSERATKDGYVRPSAKKSTSAATSSTKKK